MKLEFSGQILEEYSNIRFYENPSSASPVVPCGWTDRHDEINSPFSQFSESALKPFIIPCSSQHAVFILCRSAFLQLTLPMREKLLLVSVKNVHCGTSLANSVIAPKKGEMCGVGYCIKIY